MSSTRATTLAVGDRVKFTTDSNRWWQVRVADTQYAVCTRHRDFHPAGTYYYTVVDTTAQIRGTVEPLRLEVFASQVVGDLTDADCTGILTRLRAGDLAISRFNRVPLDLAAVPA